ncbi:PH (Pleckstrin Homology) domain-containing protein [Anseongella ginsenosidimutans]|uniref:PH (Pleckstrin Homology) domain-containing protein n=1 Tax=Anseongella ginsenosidimutans TaxID=496056 RepID=A0A4R3KUI3_9SPHI|nr:PH domain-containing protein [Anseongella ginsenosidimutans]QEC53435.1 hypothetical protein FRZ59_14550 [Anseongella ginsenosidimutans]TCS88325.1 PH (Pleckstrin Homology) domain-containing protein [Anseongella ginsenosidimutans]
MKFHSAKSPLFGIAFLGTAFTLLIIVFFDVIKDASLDFNAGRIFILLIAAFFLWFWFGTYYLIRDGKLIYRSGPISGSVKISEIHMLIKNKTLWNGMKPALATRGIIVKYNKYDEVYISPRNKDLFVEEILKINNKVTVICLD